MAAELWNVVLAAGSGRRLAPVTQGTPKQFWCSGGRRSLLDETFARIAPLAPPARTTVVVDRTHHYYVHKSARPWPAGWLLYQPADRGTAAGVLLALSPVLDADENAIVLLTPSDHGVADSAVFRAGVRDAAAAVQTGSVDVVLFGVEPSEPVTDYGWIAPGRRYEWAGDRPLYPVLDFVEKPELDVARSLFATQGLWNTMVIVAKAAALQRLFEAHVPHWAEVFATYQRLPNHQRQTYLDEQYVRLPASDFSREVLTQAKGLAVYSWGEAIGWSDLGTPDRFHHWLAGTPVRLSA
jgi:mannose-1-phosphate guanylyltransferase